MPDLRLNPVLVILATGIFDKIQPLSIILQIHPCSTQFKQFLLFYAQN
jgi:hypothetical protein